MLALATIFLITFAVSAATVWLYRRISGWHGFTESLVGSSRPVNKMKIGLQQGFISMALRSGEQARSVRLRSPRGGIKTPWGW
jgi:hypothetical protein